MWRLLDIYGRMGEYAMDGITIKTGAVIATAPVFGRLF
jgi:hypothetical protein